MNRKYNSLHKFINK